MKRSTLKTLSLIVFSFTLAISSYALDSETRKLSDFSELSVATGINLELVKGNKNEAEIEAENIDLDEILTKVEGDRLVVKVKGKWGWNGLNWRKKRINVILTYKDIEEVRVSSGAHVSSDDVLVGNDLDFNASSGASIRLEIEGNDVAADASSGANINLSGECDELDVDVSSGAGVKASRLEANYVRAGASSGATAKVWAKEKLKANASSGGSIRYDGEPEVSKRKSSGGSIRSI